MIGLFYVIGVSIAMFGIGIAAIGFEKNFVTIMLAIELIFMASTIAVVGFFEYAQPLSGAGAFISIVSIWAVAAVEVITLIAFYVYMKARGFDFDVSLLSKLKW